jgi:quercetin dioxygenase-like cupin family protein
MMLKFLIAPAVVSAALMAASPASAHGGDETVTTSFEQAIPNVPGKSLIALVVDYPPGGTSAPHLHANSAFIYAHVISGEIESKVNDGPVKAYRAGEGWHEPPGSSHPVSRNASKTNPAKLLAIIVADSSEKELTTTVLHSHEGGVR